MPPTIVQQPAPTAQPIAPAPVSTPVVVQTPEAVKPVEIKSEDLIKRASSITPQETPTNEAPRVSVSLDDVKDPVAKQILEKKLAEANAAIAKTFGEVGADKAKVLQEVDRLKAEMTKPWTPQRLQEELRRQDFVQSAQQLQASVAPPGWEGTHDEWSALNTSEKQQFQNLVTNQSHLTQQMATLLQSQVDSVLKTKYPDYDPVSVDDFIRKASAGQIPPDQIREFVHKAMNAERWVKQAYGFAMQDKAVNLQEKINGSTTMGITASLTQEKPTKAAGESDRTFFSRLGKWNLAHVKSAVANQRT